MSEKTLYSPARHLSSSTKQAIEAVIGNKRWGDYASNIESALRDRGEHGLANTMLGEIRESTRQ